VLRDEFKRLWFYRKPVWAQKAREPWIEQALQMRHRRPAIVCLALASLLARNPGALPSSTQYRYR
jgi:hypothetical protein